MRGVYNLIYSENLAHFGQKYPHQRPQSRSGKILGGRGMGAQDGRVGGGATDTGMVVTMITAAGDDEL